MKAPTPKTSERPVECTHVVRGQVLDPDGKPFAGAQIVSWLPTGAPTTGSNLPNPSGRVVQTAVSRLRFLQDALARPANQRENPLLAPFLAALASEFGPAWVKIELATGGKEPTLKLRRDDVPIVGQIIGLEGRPVSGVSVSVMAIGTVPDGLLERLQDNARQDESRALGRNARRYLAGRPGSDPQRPNRRRRSISIERNRSRPVGLIYRSRVTRSNSRSKWS